MTTSPVDASSSSPRATPALGRVVLRPRRGWQAVDFKELWRFRDLLRVLALRDIQVRYRQTVLGVLWAVLQPVAMVVVLGAIFGDWLGLKARVEPVNGVTPPYAVFLYSGQLAWVFFAGTVTAAGASLVANANMLRKVYFPRLIMPTAAVAAPLLDYTIGFLVLLGVMLWYDMSFSGGLVLVPLLLGSVLIVALGVGILVSALTVAYRDFKYLVPFMMTLWYFVTPVIYPPSIVPAGQQWLLYLNPMFGPVEGFRAVILGSTFEPAGWAVSTGVGVLILFFGLMYFSRVERRFADIA